MSKQRRRHAGRQPTAGDDRRRGNSIRIIGGHFRGRLLAYHGDPSTRPMKDRTREAIFNLLGPAIQGMHAVDLFAGTGALGLEALSRGAAKATFIERHIPTARLVQQNVTTLRVQEKADVLYADAFHWVRQDCLAPQPPWAVFCSPPYDFYESRRDDMLQLIHSLVQLCPPQSVLVVESDDRFQPTGLPHADRWDERHYRPAVIRILWCDQPG